MRNNERSMQNNDASFPSYSSQKWVCQINMMNSIVNGICESAWMASNKDEVEKQNAHVVKCGHKIWAKPEFNGKILCFYLFHKWIFRVYFL